MSEIERLRDAMRCAIVLLHADKHEPADDDGECSTCLARDILEHALADFSAAVPRE